MIQSFVSFNRCNMLGMYYTCTEICIHVYIIFFGGGGVKNDSVFLVGNIVEYILL